MNSSAGAPQPTPERIFATFTAYQQTEALKAAIELDLFTGIGEGKQQVDHAARFRPAVDVVADEKKPRGRVAPHDLVDQRPQRAEHAVDVPDDPSHQNRHPS